MADPIRLGGGADSAGQVRALATALRSGSGPVAVTAADLGVTATGWAGAAESTGWGASDETAWVARPPTASCCRNVRRRIATFPEE